MITAQRSINNCTLSLFSLQHIPLSALRLGRNDRTVGRANTALQYQFSYPTHILGSGLSVCIGCRSPGLPPPCLPGPTPNQRSGIRPQKHNTILPRQQQIQDSLPLHSRKSSRFLLGRCRVVPSVMHTPIHTPHPIQAPRRYQLYNACFALHNPSWG